MMVTEVTLAMVVILVAGGISVLALLISKFSSFIPGKSQCVSSLGYECGFKNETYLIYPDEKNGIIALYLILELTVAWLLLCCSFDTIAKSWSGKIFIRILAAIFMMAIILAYEQISVKKNKHW